MELLFMVFFLSVAVEGSSRFNLEALTKLFSSDQGYDGKEDVRLRSHLTEEDVPLVLRHNDRPSPPIRRRFQSGTATASNVGWEAPFGQSSRTDDQPSEGNPSPRINDQPSGAITPPRTGDHPPGHIPPPQTDAQVLCKYNDQSTGAPAPTPEIDHDVHTEQFRNALSESIRLLLDESKGTHPNRGRLYGIAGTQVCEHCRAVRVSYGSDKSKYVIIPEECAKRLKMIGNKITVLGEPARASFYSHYFYYPLVSVIENPHKTDTDFQVAILKIDTKPDVTLKKWRQIEGIDMKKLLRESEKRRRESGGQRH